MTDQTQKPKPRLIFATKTLQQVPFTLGGQTFIAKRLTGEEELLYQEASGVASLGLNPSETLAYLFKVLAGIFSRRSMNNAVVSNTWIEEAVGPSNVNDVMLYLRTGHNGPGLIPRPGESLDLQEIEPFEVGGRTFAGRLMNYGEYRSMKAEMDEMAGLVRAGSIARAGSGDLMGAIADGGIDHLLNDAANLYRDQAAQERKRAQVVAGLLNVRIADEGEPINGEWLLENADLEQLQAILNFYMTGKMPEADSPNAESTPANLPIQG